MKSETGINKLLSIQRAFTWQTIQVKFKKELDQMDFKRTQDLREAILNPSTSPERCVNYNSL